MIRHKPLGSGHPFSIDTDQRFPVDPVQGEPLTMGVRSTDGVAGVSLEFLIDGVEQPSLELSRTARKSRGESVDGGHLAAAQARKDRSATGWTIDLSGLKQGQVLRYRFLSKSGNTSWFETTVFGWQPSQWKIPTSGHSRVMSGLEILTDGEAVRKIRYAIKIEKGAHVTGFGERFEGVDFAGQEVDTILFEQYKNQGLEKKTYMPMSFAHVIANKGWGFWVETSRKISFDLGKTSPGRISVEVEVDGQMEIDVLPTTHFFDGEPKQVLDQFLERVGRPEELPEWVFGLWASGNEWNTQAEVLRQAQLHQETGIPISNLVIEAWSDESTFTVFRDAQLKNPGNENPDKLSDYEFPENGAWPAPKAMVDELHAQGVKLHLWQIPLLKMRPHPEGLLVTHVRQAKDEGHLIMESSQSGGLRPYRNRGWWFPLSLMPDLSDRKTAAWWTEKRRYLVRDLGIDGFKTDGGEHAWGRELTYKNGKRGDEMNWLFPVHYAKAYGDLLRSEGKAPVTFSRAGNIGSQAHGAFWAGDENSTWEAFRWSLNAGLNATASGIYYWGWDFAGFSGEVPSSELYLRSAAAACFVPIMQYHSEFNHHRKPNRDRTPWNLAERHGDESIIDKFRTIVSLRGRLMPYLSEEMRYGIGASQPLMRPVYFDFPDDESLWSADTQWMLGRYMLVAPIIEEGESTRTVHLPSGQRWVHADTGETHDGGTNPLVSAGLTSVPVFVLESHWDALKDIFIER
jgi:alpha-glucosidase (family GH31 glycosyl hydrolase)